MIIYIFLKVHIEISTPIEVHHLKIMKLILSVDGNAQDTSLGFSPLIDFGRLRNNFKRKNTRENVDIRYTG